MHEAVVDPAKLLTIPSKSYFPAKLFTIPSKILFPFIP